MSNWLPYDSFVDLVRNHHHNGFTGLITGVSDDQHSFQIGFHDGNVILLTYRILKGSPALEKLTQINRAKITEHPTTEVPVSQIELPDTSSILSRLTIQTNDETQPEIANIIPDVPQPEGMAAVQAATPTASHEQKKSAPQKPPDSNRINAIKSAAIHHFGPIGAMVCEEYLSSSNLSNIDLSTLLHRIAEEVGANDADTQAFLESAS